MGPKDFNGLFYKYSFILQTHLEVWRNCLEMLKINMFWNLKKIGEVFLCIVKTIFIFQMIGAAREVEDNKTTFF